MNLWLLVGGALIAAFGCVETVWALRADFPRHTLAQGIFFVELGLAFIVLALLPEGIMRTSLAAAFGVSALVSAFVQHRLMRAEKRGQADRAEGNA